MPTQFDGRLFLKYKNNYSTFIETGTYLGDGVQAALNAGFSKVISIELAPTHYSICKNRFIENPNVDILFGDSRLLLPNILKTYNKNILFWLDAHCSGGQTSGDGVENTIEKELTALKDAKIKNFTLLLDDMNEELIDLYSIKCTELFDVKNIQVENGYQEHTGKIFDNSILSIVISE
jgi:hypothetical protein